MFASNIKLYHIYAHAAVGTELIHLLTLRDGGSRSMARLLAFSRQLAIGIYLAKRIISLPMIRSMLYMERRNGRNGSSFNTPPIVDGNGQIGREDQGLSIKN